MSILIILEAAIQFPPVVPAESVEDEYFPTGSAGGLARQGRARRATTKDKTQQQQLSIGNGRSTVKLISYLVNTETTG